MVMGLPLPPQLTPLGRLERTIQELIQSVRLCREQRLFGSALTLMYSGIDIMASLARDAGHIDVDRTDFIRWADDYMLPGSNLNCAAIDLYAARCGVLHSLSYRARLIREGRAREIRYIFDDADAVREIMADLERQGGNTIVVVNFETLIQAFENGLRRFLENLENDQQGNALTIGRINTELIFFPLIGFIG